MLLLILKKLNKNECVCLCLYVSTAKIRTYTYMNLYSTYKLIEYKLYICSHYKCAFKPYAY